MADTATVSLPGEDVTNLAVRIIELAERLHAVLVRETALVRALRIKEAGPLQPEKTQLAELYRKTFKSLVARQGEGELPAPLKARLRDAGEGLAKAVRENALILRVGQAATERLIIAIVTAINAQRKTALGYAPQRKTLRGVRPAAVDRRL